MTKRTVIFMGNSGCGKGTQARLLEERWKQDGESVFHLEIGSEFRDFLNMTTYTAELAREIAKSGELQPEFLAVKMWANLFNLYYSPKKSVIIDGSPRRISEAWLLHETLKFYKIDKPIVFYINVSDEVARERMLSRGRKDDTEEKIKNRLDWFKRDVMKTIEMFKENDYYEFYEIDGEKTVEEIHENIKEKLALS